MISSLDEYKARATGFSRMVGDLEGGLDAREFRDKSLVSEFYDVWTDLETANALEGDDVRYVEVADAVDAMHRFLTVRLSEAERAG